MNDVPLTRLAFAVQGVQRGLAMDIVQTAIHDASHQTFKGMDLSCAAPDTWVRHGSLLHGGATFPQHFYVR
jgi:hypothetical protein